MNGLKRGLGAYASAVLLTGLASGAAWSVEPVTTATLKEFERANQQTFVLEYIDPKTDEIAKRLVESLTSEPVVTSVAERRYNGHEVSSYGIKACPKAAILYGGKPVDCRTESTAFLRDVHRNSTVILCRAFLSEAGKAVQEANCYYLNRDRQRAGSIDDLVVSLGFGDLARDPQGRVLRTDLVAARDRAEREGLGIHGTR